MNERLMQLEDLGGMELVRDVIGAFLESAPQQLSVARESSEQGDARKAERALHTLKASADQLGETRLRDICARGEALARRGELAGIIEVLSGADTAFLVAAPELRRIAGDPRSSR